MDQKILSPFNDFPIDILGRLFGFFDRLTLIDITRVNKNWCVIAEPQLSKALFQHYHTQTPDALKEGYLLNALCDWLKSHQPDKGDIFSEEQQKSFKEQFFQAAWGLTINSAETPLQFITRVRETFQTGIENKGDEDDQMIRSEYLQRYSGKAPSQINFLFCTEHVQRFSKLYDAKTHTLLSITRDADRKFLAQFLAYTQDIESFLTVLIFFDATYQMPVLQRWQLLQRNYVKHTLRGDGMAALSTQDPNLISGLLNQWHYPHGPCSAPFSTEEVQFFLKKLCPLDLIAYIHLSGLTVKEAICARQPHIIALLSSGNMVSDMAVIHILNKTSTEDFLDLVEPVPELRLRLKDPLFFDRFHASTVLSNTKKSWLAKELLCHLTFVKDLQEPELILLAQHLVLYVSNEMSKVLAVLSIANKLTGSFLLALAKVAIPHHVGHYALLIAQDIKARAVLAQKENAEYAFGIIKIAFESAYSQNKRCELLHDTAVIQNFTFKQLRLLYASIQSGVDYLEERRIKESCLQNYYIAKLAKEPDDQVFIDELFIKPSNTFLRDNLNVWTRLIGIQSNVSLNYLYQKSVALCSQSTDSAAEQRTKKKFVLSFLVCGKFLAQFDDTQLLWLADPSCYTFARNSFFAFFDSLFSFKRMTKALFLKLTALPAISDLLCYSMQQIAINFGNRHYSYLNQDLELAFELIHYQLRTFDESAYNFLTPFKGIIQKFTLDQRIALLENTKTKENQWAMPRYFTVDELRALWQKTTAKIPYPLREAFFVFRLYQGTSVEQFATEVVGCEIEFRKRWCQKYPAFSSRLKQTDVYQFVFGKCVSLLTINNEKSLDYKTSNWLELLVFLQTLSPIHDKTQKQTILGTYTSQQLYTLCLQLKAEKTRNSPTLKTLKNLFYPLCFELLDITHLQQLKEKITPKTLKSSLWSNPLTQKLEDNLSKKIKTEGASIRDWGDAITTSQRNLVLLLLLLVGISLLVPGLVLNIAILWAIAVAALTIGFGIVGIPLLRTAIHSIGKSSPEKTPLLTSDNAPTQTKHEEITSQETFSTQTNPIPFKSMFQPDAPSISTQTNAQEGSQTPPLTPSPY